MIQKTSNTKRSPNAPFGQLSQAADELLCPPEACPWSRQGAAGLDELRYVACYWSDGRGVDLLHHRPESGLRGFRCEVKFHVKRKRAPLSWPADVHCAGLARRRILLLLLIITCSPSGMYRPSTGLLWRPGCQSCVVQAHR